MCQALLGTKDVVLGLSAEVNGLSEGVRGWVRWRVLGTELGSFRAVGWGGVVRHS